VLGVNSKVTKQSDHYVLKDTSERVVRRCDNTVVKKWVNSCVLKHLCFERVEQPKILTKPPGHALSHCNVFKISRLTPQKKKPRFETAFRAVLISSLVH